MAELKPPTAFGLDDWLTDARTLSGLADCIQLTDMPGARVHMDSLVPAARLCDLGFDVMVTMTSRDRNAIAQQARMLGAAALGVSSLFFVLGDPVALGDHPQARPVFERDTLGWIEVARTLRDTGYLVSGRPVEGASNANYLIGASVAPDVSPERALLRNMSGKCRAGADFFMTQPVFELGRLYRLMDSWSREIVDDPPVIVAGLAALPSLQAALELDALPGISVPPHLLAELEAASPAQQAQLGLTWTERLISDLRSDGRAAGVLLYPMAPHAQHIRRVCERAFS